MVEFQSVPLAALVAILCFVAGIVFDRRVFAADAGRLQQEVTGLTATKATLEQHVRMASEERDRERAEREQARKECGEAAARAAAMASEAALLRDRLEELTKAETKLRADREAGAEAEKRLQADFSALAEREENLKAQLAERQAELENLNKKLQKEFESIANRLLDATTQKLTVASEEKLTNLLSPFRERLTEFQKKVEDSYGDEAKERRQLQGMITQIAEANRCLSDQAENLTKALRGDSQKRGRWGELVLERILEESGLRKGHEYVLQGRDLGLKSEAGGPQRPDVIVRLPEGRHIIVDSKVTLASYDDYTNAGDAERDRLCKEFVAAVRLHIDGLAGKRYQDNDKLIAHDMVFMFVPIESAMAVCFQGDDALFNYAWQRRVALVGPTTLMMTLRIVEAIWRYERQRENAAAIGEAAAKLYEKLEGFVADLNAVGKGLNVAKEKYDSAYRKLATGPGNALRQAEKFRQLGVRPKKVISATGVEGVGLDAEVREEPGPPSADALLAAAE